MAQAPHGSHFLNRLPPADINLLRSRLKPLDLAQGVVLHEAGDPIRTAYFPHDGVVSLVVPLTEGDTIEAAMVGRAGVVGGSAALTGGTSLCTAIVQLRGHASAIPIEEL